MSWLVLLLWCALIAIPAVGLMIAKPHLVKKISRGVTPVFVLALCICLALTGCTLSQVQTDLQKVIADLPSILQIAGEIIVIVGAVKGDPALTPDLMNQAKQAQTAVVADLTVIQQVLTAYQSGLATAPASVLTKLDDAIAAIQQNLMALEAAFHVTSPTTQAAIGAVTTAVSAFLLGVVSLIPTPVAAQSFPKSMKLSVLAQSSPGPLLPYIIPTRRALAQGYNGKQPVKAAHVHVPWMKLGPVPVMP